MAIIGDAALVFPFRALGVKTYSPRDVDEARSILEGLEKQNVALCFLHMRYFTALKEEREELTHRLCPVVIGFSDYREVTDRLLDAMREITVKATGSDSLFKRKG